MSEVIQEYPNIVEKVVKNGYCVGCGGCAYLSKSISIEMDKFGKLIPTIDASESISESANNLISKVCPFSGAGDDEDHIGNSLFSNLPKNPEIGHHHSIYAGRTAENDFYNAGSSGGIAKWLLSKLLEENLVDYVIQVTESENNEPGKALYAFQVFDSAGDVIKGSKSAYYPVEMSTMLSFMKDNEGRYAVTGVPCFIKMLRRLSSVDTIIKSRLTFAISIICGHLKSTGYAEMIGWQLGVDPNVLAGIDFRKKIPGAKANQKGVQAKDSSGVMSREDIVQNLFGTNYGHGLFKYEACDYCDDVVGETADVSIGDAWLPQFMSSGTSLVIIRNEKLADFIQKHRVELDVTTLSDLEAANSQRAGLRHRREYLKFRLFMKEKAGVWYPKKRVLPEGAHLSFLMKKLVRARVEIAQLSHTAFASSKSRSDFNYFKQKLKYHMELMHDVRRPLGKYLVARFLRLIGVYDLLALISKKLNSANRSS